MIKAIIFDLDGTLYTSRTVYGKFAEAAYHTYEKFAGVGRAAAKAILEKRRAAMKKRTGHAVAYTRVLISFGIPIAAWHRENIAYFDAGGLLRRDRRLKKALTRLKDKYRLAVLTNNNRIQTGRILAALGIENLFDRVFTYNTFKRLKPDRAILRNVAKRLKLDYAECLVVGDRREVDLEPARCLGMKTRQVKGPEDIYRLKV